MGNWYRTMLKNTILLTKKAQLSFEIFKPAKMHSIAKKQDEIWFPADKQGESVDLVSKKAKCDFD